MLLQLLLHFTFVYRWGNSRYDLLNFNNIVINDIVNKKSFYNYLWVEHMLLHIFNTTFKSDDKQSIRADSMLVPWICSFYNPSSCWIMSSFLDWFFPFISLVPQIDKSCRKFDANNKPFDRTRSLAVHQNLVDRANENAWIKLGFSSAKYFRQYEKDKKNYDWIPEDSPYRH